MNLTKKADLRENRAEIIIQSILQGFISRKKKTKSVTKMLFILNLFDTKLDLANKEDRNIFESGTKGLPNGFQLVGDKEIFNDFRKII